MKHRLVCAFCLVLLIVVGVIEKHQQRNRLRLAKQVSSLQKEYKELSSSQAVLLTHQARFEQIVALNTQEQDRRLGLIAQLESLSLKSGITDFSIETKPARSIDPMSAYYIRKDKESSNAEYDLIPVSLVLNFQRENVLLEFIDSLGQMGAIATDLTQCVIDINSSESPVYQEIPESQESSESRETGNHLYKLQARCELQMVIYAV